MLYFKDIAQFTTPITLTMCLIIGMGIKRKDIFCVDSAFSIIGLFLGLSITFINKWYSNNYIFSLGILISVASAAYLRYRASVLTETNAKVYFLNQMSTLKLINILYWICIAVTASSYYGADSYQRPVTFFLSLCLAVTFLSVEIIYSNTDKSSFVYSIIIKIFLISLILKASGWFISPYPVGHDSWAHYEYIKNFLNYSHLQVDNYPSGTGMNSYYTSYPIAHLLACTIKLIGNIDIKQSMFIISLALTLSTIFPYLITKEILKDEKTALFSMLLLNISDGYNTWGIIIVAMSLGIAIYSIILFLLLKRDNENKIIYRSLVILYIILIVYTHIISSFIVILSILMITIGKVIYPLIYKRFEKKIDYKKLLNASSLIFATTTIIITHWMDPRYPILDSIVMGLSNSLNAESHFLNRSTFSNVQDSLDTLLNIFGFLIYTGLGIIGTFISLSRKYVNEIKFGYIFTYIMLYFIMFIFPLFGMKDILSFRWPAFIYVIFTMFVSIGIISVLNSITNPFRKTTLLCTLMIIGSFFMTTTYYANTDSPIFGAATTEKLVWTDSEMELFKTINRTYQGIVVSDLQTEIRPFKTYFNQKNSTSFQLTNEGKINWNYLDGKLVIWRKSNLERPIQMGGPTKPSYLLGYQFENKLENDFNKLYSSGEATAYKSSVLKF